MTYFKLLILSITTTASLLLLTATTVYCKDTTDLQLQTFHESRQVSEPRLSSPSPSRSCWIGREVSATYDRPPSSPPSESMLNSRSYVTVCPSLRIKCHGRITSWRATLTVADRNPINFAVFRSTQDASGQRFTMVGYNTFAAGPLGRVVFEVPESKQLAVKPGDIFGYFRMGAGQPEFIGFVNVDSNQQSPSDEQQQHQQRKNIVTGNYDSCYQLSITYIDLIKANYKVTIDSNAVLLKRLYSLAAVVEATNSSKSNSYRRSQKLSSIAPFGYRPSQIRVSYLRGEVANRSRLVQNKLSNFRGKMVMLDDDSSRPPQPVVPFLRWRQSTTTTPTTTPTTTTTTTTVAPTAGKITGEDFQRYLNGPQLDHVAAFRVPRRHQKTTNNRSLPNNNNNNNNNNSVNNRSQQQVRPSARQASVEIDNGLVWCGEPPTIENAYSVNEILAQIRLPTRSYACQSGYTPVGYNRIFCDPSTRKWTPLTFQCVFTIIMEDPPTKPAPGVPATVVITPRPIGNKPGPLPGGPDPTLNTCLFPPIIDNGYAIRQDDITVIYRCYPGFLKVGQVDQDGSTCDRATNVWTPPLVNCVLGRNTVTIPLNTPTTTPVPEIDIRPPPPPIFVPPQPATREVLVMPNFITTPSPWRTLPAAVPHQAAPPNQMRPQFAPQPMPIIRVPDSYVQQGATVAIPLEAGKPVTPQPPVTVALPGLFPQQANVIVPVPSRQESPSLYPSFFPTNPLGPSSANILDCGLPPRIANGRYYQDPDPYYPAKSYIYECYPGYVMRGQPVVFCNPYYGRFTQLTARCDPMGLEITPLPTRPPTTTKPPFAIEEQTDCGTPPPIANAFTVTGGKKSSAVYLCLPGFTGIGVAEIQCIQPPLIDDDPGRGPTWSQSSFQCVPTAQMTTPRTTRPTPKTTTTTTPEPTTEFQPFLIIPGPRRTTPAKSNWPEPATVTVPLVNNNPNEITKAQQWQPIWPTTTQGIRILLPNRPRLPPGYELEPPSDNNDNVQRVTPPPALLPRTVMANWQNVETLQPTKWVPSVTLSPIDQPLQTAGAGDRLVMDRTTKSPWLLPRGSEGEPPESGVEGTCLVYQTCGEPPAVPNAKIEGSYKGRHSCPGDYVRYVCDPGYRLDSLVSAVFCSQATYSWSPGRPPSCLPNPAFINNKH